jgi:hypothetical protein
VIRVHPRARRGDDRAGDPLDGLVNLFDLGIVLSVAFLLAALSSLKLSSALTGPRPAVTPAIPVGPGQVVRQLPSPGVPTSGVGTPVGEVYQLPDGRLVYVSGPLASASPSSAP